MPVWLLFVVLSAGVAATLVWHGMAKTKHTSELLLREYNKLLAESRNKLGVEEPVEVSEAGDSSGGAKRD